jgi:hypothetical protein
MHIPVATDEGDYDSADIQVQRGKVRRRSGNGVVY